MNFFKIFNIYNIFIFNLIFIKNKILISFLQTFIFLHNYFILNELIWQEGFLLDFLQKKSIDNFLKKFVIYSANLFSERLVFDKIIKFYIDLFIWPTHKLFIFEFNNVSNLLFINMFLFFICFFLLFFMFLFFFMF